MPFRAAGPEVWDHVHHPHGANGSRHGTSTGTAEGRVAARPGSAWPDRVGVDRHSGGLGLRAASSRSRAPTAIPQIKNIMQVGPSISRRSANEPDTIWVPMAQMATKARRRPISPADGRIQYACNSRPMMGTSTHSHSSRPRMPSSTRIPNSVSCEAMPSPLIHGNVVGPLLVVVEVDRLESTDAPSEPGLPLEGPDRGGDPVQAIPHLVNGSDSPCCPVRAGEGRPVQADHEGDRADQASEHAAGSRHQEDAEDQHKRESQPIRRARG